MRKHPLTALVGGKPELQHEIFDAAHGFVLGNAGVRDAVEVPLEQSLLVRRRQVAVVGHALVVGMGHQVEDVLLEVGPRAANCMDPARANHLGERDPELCRAHRACHREKHLPAAVDVPREGI